MARKKSSELKRISTGIKGLDPLISGGFVKGNSVLICGAPGTGKTLLGLQYLYHGAQQGENGLFVSIEDHPDKLTMYGRTFGWDLEGLRKKKKLDLINIPIDQKGYNIVNTIAKKVREYNISRVVVDSLSALNFNAKMFCLPLVNQPDPTGTIARSKILKVAGYAPFEDFIQFTYLFVKRVSDLGPTTLFITDSPDDGRALTKDTVSEYACDGVVQVQLHDTSQNVNRTLAVKKMRGGSIVPGMKSLKFTKGGLEVGEYKVYY